MARLFGTDGVRGVANQDLTAELALGLGSAAARRLGSVGGHARRIAVVGRDPRASSEMLEAAVIAGVTSEGRRRTARRRPAHPGGGIPDPRVRRRLRRDDLGVAQPDAGQRHQDLRARRPQARRRRRGPHRRAGHPGSREPADRCGHRPRRRRRGRAGPLPAPRRQGAYHPARRPHRRRRLRTRRRVDRRAAGVPRGGRERHCDQRRAQRAEHQRRLRVHTHGAGCRRP